MWLSMAPAVTIRFSPGDHFGRRAHDQFRIDAVHRVRISRLADLDDAAVANADIAFHDAPVIDDRERS